MFNRIKHIITFLWPAIESLIIATLIGMNIGTLASIVVIFIGVFVSSLIYGSIIRCIGWGICGMTFFVENFHLILDTLLGLIFFSFRFFGAKLIKKFAS